MDGGKVAEFDTVLNLFDKDSEDSILRSLCDEANLQRSDIVKIQAEHNVHAWVLLEAVLFSCTPV
jgi:ATP-binding cassette subfamily C (CFTR/MRP) protein 1